MPRRTREQARAANERVRRKVDDAKAKGHAMLDLVHEVGQGWSTSCVCGWESGWRRSSRVLAGQIAMHLAWVAEGEPAGEPVPNAYEYGSSELRDPAKLVAEEKEIPSRSPGVPA